MTAVWRVGCIVGCTIGLVMDATAQAVPTMATVRGEVSFDGRGTPGPFTGRTRTVRGRLIGGPTIESARGWVEADAATLLTGSGRRDRDMRKSLEVERFPALRFDLDGAGAGVRSGDSIPVTLRGRFTIHGVTRESAVRGWLRADSTRVVFRGSTPLVLTDYDIGGLSRAFGLLKMQRDIIVRMDLVFEP